MSSETTFTASPTDFSSVVVVVSKPCREKAGQLRGGSLLLGNGCVPTRSLIMMVEKELTTPFGMALYAGESVRLIPLPQARTG